MDQGYKRFTDCGDDPAHRRAKRPLWRTLRQKRAAPRPELHREALRRVAMTVVGRKEFMEHTESLADELKVSLERLYFIALVGFFEQYQEKLKTRADEVHTPSSYGEASELTEEEFNAILEADRLESELAESHKDLLED